MRGKSLKRWKVFLINSNAFNTNEWNEKVVIKRLAINSFISDAHSIENLKKILYEHLNLKLLSNEKGL